MTEQEQDFLQSIKNYILTKCVGTVDETTDKKITPSIWKKDIHKYLHKYTKGYFHFKPAEIDKLLHQAIFELIENNDIIDGEHFFYIYV